MVHLKKNKFLVGTYSELKKKFGPCRILKKHNTGNIFEVELSEDMGISLMLNITDTVEYHESDKEIVDKLNYPKKKKEGIENILHT